MAPNCIEDQSLKMIRNVSLNILNGNRIRGHTVRFHEFLFEKSPKNQKDRQKDHPKARQKYHQKIVE